MTLVQNVWKITLSLEQQSVRNLLLLLKAWTPDHYRRHRSGAELKALGRCGRGGRPWGEAVGERLGEEAMLPGRSLLRLPKVGRSLPVGGGRVAPSVAASVVARARRGSGSRPLHSWNPLPGLDAESTRNCRLVGVQTARLANPGQFGPGFVQPEKSRGTQGESL
jgi:hypothetical protein